MPSDALARAKAAIRLVLSESKAWPAVFDPATADLLAERIVGASFPILAEDLVAIAEHRHEQWRLPHRDDAELGEVCDDISACRDIASALRARIAEIAGGRDG